MVELHGWATIREFFTLQDDDSDEKIEQIIGELGDTISRIHWGNGLLDLRAVNGEYFLTVNIFTNHRDDRVGDALRLFQHIAKVAPGSYGLLYLNDDEDQSGHENEFLVYLLAKGTLTEHKDQLLSPLIPTVEE